MNDENNYFHNKDRDLIEEARREKTREELRQREIGQIGEVLGVTPDIARSVYQLGFGADSARLLHLVPVIQVAWADGSVQKEEREKLLELAKLRGISQDDSNPSWNFLNQLLTHRPEQRFFDEVNQLISTALKNDSHTSPESILDNCRKIAETSGGFLGLGAVSKQEQTLLKELSYLFEVDK